MVDPRPLFAVDGGRRAFRSDGHSLVPVDACDLSPEESALFLSSRVGYLRRPFNSIVNAQDGDVLSTLPVPVSVFFPLTPLDFVGGIDSYLAGRPVSPIRLEVDPTNRCNFRCGMCYNSDSRKANPNEVSLGVYEGLVRKMRSSNDVVAVSISGGGEPTFHPDIKKMLSFNLDLGVYTYLTTNGSQCDPGLKDMVARSVSVLTFSVPGMQDDVYHDLVRRHLASL